MSILSPSDFTDFHVISKDQYTKAKLQLYIDRYEKSLLCTLLGDSLSKDVIAYFNSVKEPSNEELDAIIDPFCINIQGASDKYYPFERHYYWNLYPHRCKDYQFLSRGIEEYLKGFIYYKFTTQDPIKQTPSGASESQYSSANKVPSKKNYRSAEKRRNEALNTFEAIQYKICENIEDYPTYNGIDSPPVFQDIL